MSAPVDAQIKPDGLTQTDESPKVRTLHEPPDIWDLVHETRVEFKPGFAFAGRLKSLFPWVLVAILLVAGGGAVFWLMRSKDSSVSSPATSNAPPPVQAGSSNTKTVLNPQAPEPNRTASSSDQPSNSAPASADTAGKPIVEPKPVVAEPAASADRSVATKPRPQNSTTSTIAVGETVAGTRKKDRTQTSNLTKAVNAKAPRTNNKDAVQTSTTLGSKSDKQSDAGPTAAKKQADKAPSPQLIAPAKASPTPKAKVIPWP